MALRYFRNGPARALAFPLANGTDTAITVDSASGFPIQFPYTIIIDPNLSTEEVCDVTAAVGNVLTITRGVDSTTAVAHGAGAVVYHGVSARDPREANEHVNATTNVHGRTGALVDTDSVQSIPGRKIFDDAESTGGGNFVDVGSTQTVTGAKTFSGTTTLGAANVGGTAAFTGTETHIGTETHAGLIRFNNAVLQPTPISSTVDETSSSTAFTPGTTPVGVAAVVPPSGKFIVHFTAFFQESINGNNAIVSVAVRNGGAVGSGTVLVAPSGDRALVCGQAVNASAPAQLQATRSFLLVGLTPGDTINFQIEFQTNPAGGILVFYREILLVPVL